MLKSLSSGIEVTLYVLCASVANPMTVAAEG